MTPCPTCRAAPCECWTQAIARPLLPTMELRWLNGVLQQKWLVWINGVKGTQWRAVPRASEALEALHRNLPQPSGNSEGI